MAHRRWIARPRIVLAKDSQTKRTAWYDHAFTRTTLTMLQIGSVLIAATGLWLASQNFASSTRMSAYQLLANDTAPMTARWQAAQTVLEVDNQIVGFSGTCEIACDVLRGFKIVGRSAAVRRVVARFNLPGGNFVKSELKNIIFEDGDFSRTWFVQSALENVAFIKVNLSATRFDQDATLADPDEVDPLFGYEANYVGPAPIEIMAIGSNFSHARLEGANLSGFNKIYGSDFSDADIRGAGAEVLHGKKNYFQRGHPPRLNGEPMPSLVDAMCLSGWSIGSEVGVDCVDPVTGQALSLAGPVGEPARPISAPSSGPQPVPQ